LFNSKNVEFLHRSYQNIDPSINDLIYLDPPYSSIENKMGMYNGRFNNTEFIKWLNTLTTKYILSYDGKINNNIVEHTNPVFVRHFHLTSGNSSFRRTIGKSNNTIISESLYLNF
jgi:site-specific DNA-adenine methylase